MISTDILKKCNIGKDSVVKFKDDDKLYYVKNISLDRENIFVTNGNTTYRKSIKNLVRCDNKILNEEVKNIRKNLLLEFSIDSIDTPSFQTYEAAKARLGDKDRVNLHKKIIWLVRGTNSDICVKYHQTNVICFDQMGNVTLKSGGWQTRSTRNVINYYLPKGAQVFGKDENIRRSSEWYIKGRNGTFPFEEEIVITNHGDVLH
jgi:hypothetical protein